MTDGLAKRLRASASQARAIDRAELLREAADQLERLIDERNFWMHQAQAFSEHADTMRLALLGQLPALSHGERDAIGYAADRFAEFPPYSHCAATLRGILRRFA